MGESQYNASLDATVKQYAAAHQAYAPLSVTVVTDTAVLEVLFEVSTALGIGSLSSCRSDSDVDLFNDHLEHLAIFGHGRSGNDGGTVSWHITRWGNGDGRISSRRGSRRLAGVDVGDKDAAAVPVGD